MAKENPQEETPQPPPPTSEGKASFLSPKILLFGGGVFVIQLLLIFFVVRFFLSPADTSGHSASPVGSQHGAEGGEEASGAKEQKMFVVKDIIVNPAATNGTRFLLTTVGFEVEGAEALTEIERKEVQVRDALISILTSKGLNELVDPSRRDSLRGEITRHVSGILRPGSLRSVYFSKFVIQ